MTHSLKMATTIALKTGKSRKENVAYNEASIRANAGFLDYCRTSMCALAGCTAGIMGLTSFYGFAFYFMTAFVLSLMLFFKAGSQWNRYFRTRTELCTGGVFGGLFTYVLFWTFLYGMVHVY